MREVIWQGMAEEFQEVPPAEHCIFALAEACTISNNSSHIICHVLGSFLIWYIEEPANHIPHAADNII